jgi:hypothetical protein
MSRPPRDNRFLALRAAGQDATEFALTDDTIERFLTLRDQGAGETELAGKLGLEPEVVAELVAADESYAVAHRIAEGEEPMYPLPGPADQVVDIRSGSSAVPIAVLIVVLLAVIVYGLLR